MIREAAEQDLPAILDIYNDAILNTTALYAYRPYTLEDRKQWFADKRKNGYPLLVLEQEGRVIAFATFGPFRAFPAYRYTVEHSVYVHKDYRHLGAGKRLLGELIKLATAQEYATLVAGIDAANEGSIRLHEAFGFTHSGTIARSGFKFGRWLDLAFYQLNLPGPAEPREE